jgi:hypothetical protein
MLLRAIPFVAILAWTWLARGDSQALEVSGHYTYGWERSQFVACGSGERWWVRMEPDSLANKLRQSTRRLRPQPDTAAWEGTLFARFRGDLTSRGRYGHLDKYHRELRVYQILELRNPQAADCRSTP